MEAIEEESFEGSSLYQPPPPLTIDVGLTEAEA
jgi:hypothetical protein